MRRSRETAWEVADKEILRYREALRHNVKAHPGICRDMIDKWLDYRSQHRAGELRAKL